MKIISTTSLRHPHRHADAPDTGLAGSNPTALAMRADRPPVRPFDPELREALIAFKAEHELSDHRLATLAGTNSTQVNRYINGRFIGDLEAFEARIKSLFKDEGERRVNVDELFANPFTANVAAFLDTVRRTQDMGIGYTHAGKGKTSGISLFRSVNPSALSITLSQWNCGVSGVTSLLFNAFDHRGWNRRMPRPDFIMKRLTGSRRLVILDNAHRLTDGALKWMFDFHDETGCPVAFVCNPELLDRIRGNDQQFSRIGIKWEFKSGKKQAAMAAALAADCLRMTRLHWPDAEGKLGDLPQQVARHHGYLRSLKKQLLLARELHGGDGIETYEDAFRSAHTQLVRDYPLV